MIRVTISEVKARFNELIDRVEAGEDLIVTRRGRPVVKMITVRSVKQSIPSLSAFRVSIPRRKGSSAEALRQLRDEDA